MARTDFRSWIGYVKGFGFIFLVFHTSYFGTLFLLTPFLPLLFVAPRFARTCLDFFIWLWKLYCVALYETLFNTKVTVFGDIPNPKECTLMIMNHRTRFDWLYLFSYQVRYASIRRYTISLKNIIKYAPGLGWAMQMAGYIFLKRKWEEDEEEITRCIHLFKQIDFKPQVLLFPEGTDLTPNTKARSDHFAKKNDLPVYNYVLHPRTTGFTHIVQQMKEAEILESLVDVTIAYPGRIPQNESDIIQGKFPPEIHFYMKTYSNSEFPSQKDELDTWCQKAWDEKEEFLKDFYENKESHRKTEAKKHQMNEECIKNLFINTLMLWTLFEVLVTVILWLYPSVWWYILGTTIFYLYISRFTSGFALLIASAFGC